MEQSLLVTPSSSVSVPDLLGTTGEPQSERSVNQAPRVPASTSQMLSSISSGTSGAPITPPAMPSGQEVIAADGLMSSGTSQLQPEALSSTRDSDIYQISDEPFVELAAPAQGPTTGCIPIVILGRNFPATPLYVWFGGNPIHAVSPV